MLDQIATDGMRLSEMLLKQIKAGAPDSAGLVAAYERLTREVLLTTAYQRKLQAYAARIAERQSGGHDAASRPMPPAPDASTSPSGASSLRSRLEREFFVDALTQSSKIPDRLH